MSSRETELYKDKVEVSLDGRQIFYLFFGGAVIVGMVFVLGVLVGRRVEARGHVDRARTHSATDPLAALDRLEGNGGLSFRGALTGKDAPSDVERQIGVLEKERAKAPSEAKPSKGEAAIKAEPKAEPKPEPKAERVEKQAEPKAEPAPKKAEVKAEAKVEAKAEAKPVTKPQASYTLQLAAFQVKAEAEALVTSIKAKGYDARITEAQVSGKEWYRVRTGTYASLDAVTAAKPEVEKASRTTSSIVKL